MRPSAFPRLRPAARAIVLDESDRVLLCRFAFEKPEGLAVVWLPPAAGSSLDSLRCQRSGVSSTRRSGSN
jgi:hypothetical protein